MISTNKEQLQKIVSRFAGQPIMVVGDLILDHFVWGVVDRISPEAPVPVVRVTKESFHLGGAANVARNLSILGAQPLLVGVVGCDRTGKQLVELLESENISSTGLIRVVDRTTTLKTRIVAQHQQVCRTDRESLEPPSEETLSQINDSYLRYLNKANGIVISDYAKGVLSQVLVPDWIQEARQKNIFLAVDPKQADFSSYEGASLITPNTREAETASGIEAVDEVSFVQLGQRLLKVTKADSLLITRGEEGMTLFEGRGCDHIPTVAREVFDVTGAGDTVIASLTLAVTAGASISEAAVLANHAAGVAVGKLGTAAPTTDEILASIGHG